MFLGLCSPTKILLLLFKLSDCINPNEKNMLGSVTTSVLERAIQLLDWRNLPPRDKPEKFHIFQSTALLMNAKYFRKQLIL